MTSQSKNLFVEKLLFLVILIGFSGAACISVKPIYYDADKKLAYAKGEEFHQLFGEKKYEEIYKNTFSSESRKLLSFENFLAAFGEYRTNCGKVKNSKLVKEGIQPEASYRRIDLIYETELENCLMRERIVFHVDGEKAEIYFFDKPAPISKDK